MCNICNFFFCLQILEDKLLSRAVLHLDLFWSPWYSQKSENKINPLKISCCSITFAAQQGSFTKLWHMVVFTTNLWIISYLQSAKGEIFWNKNKRTRNLSNICSKNTCIWVNSRNAPFFYYHFSFKYMYFTFIYSMYYWHHKQIWYGVKCVHSKWFK